MGAHHDGGAVRRSSRGSARARRATTRGRGPRSARRRAAARAGAARCGTGRGGSSCRWSSRRPGRRGRPRCRTAPAASRMRASTGRARGRGRRARPSSGGCRGPTGGRRGPAWPTRRRSEPAPRRRRPAGSRPNTRTVPGIGGEGAGDHADGGGLAGPVRAEQHGDLPAGHATGRRSSRARFAPKCFTTPSRTMTGCGRRPSGRR